MRAARTLLTVLLALVTFPIQMFIVYRLLVATNQSELVWFLYWAYVPLYVLMVALLKVVERQK